MIALVSTLCLLAAPPALPAELAASLRAAREHSRTLLISRAQLAQQQAQVAQAIAALLPTFQATGGYTRNQYLGAIALPNLPTSFGPGEAGATTSTLTIQPQDQLQATLTLNVPLVEPGAIARLAEGRHGAASSAQSELASELEVQLSVARAYYQVVAAQGVLAAAVRSLKVSQDAEAVSRAKLELGKANQLTLDKARVDVSRAEQTVAESQRTLGLARRSLETLTGVAVTTDFPAPVDPSLPALTATAERDCVDAAQASRPEVRQAREALAQASATKDEAWSQLAPTVLGQAQEHLQNYTGFIGHEGYWSVGVSFAWTLDPAGTRASVRKAEGALAEQRARLAQALDTVRDDVHSAWLDVVADAARARETRVEADSSREALELTQDQFKTGTATALDLSQAERDAFTAEVNRVQADSDLATALLSLQKASGEPLLANGSSAPEASR